MSTDTRTKPRKGGIQSLAKRRTDVLHIDPSLIRIREGFNGRDWSDPANPEHVLFLADQILAEGGIRQPLTVYMEDGAVWLEHGECRLRAVLHLTYERGESISTVPVRISKSADEADRIAGMLMDNSSKPLSTLETAGVIRRLLDAGWTREHISQRTGYSANRLKQLEEVATLPNAVREKVAEGVVSATEAARVVREHGEDAPAVIERAAASTAGQGGKKAGRATRASLEAATKPQEAPEEPGVDAGEPPASPGPASAAEQPRIGCKAVLEILRNAAAFKGTETVSVQIPIADWGRISALF